MRPSDVVGIAVAQIRGNPLRTFFTLLGIIVSVAFLIAVVAIIQGMNAYVKENIADAMVGTNAFQVRRTPIQVGLIDDELMARIRRRPVISPEDAEAVRAALPEAIAVSRQSGWPTPITEVFWRGRSVGGILIFGITPEFQVVQDYRVRAGRPISPVDVSQRMNSVVLGTELAEKLFETVDPIGQEVRLAGERFVVVGVNEPKGRVLGQSFDAYVLIPISRFEMRFGRRLTTTISVKASDTSDVDGMMARAEEAMRVAHGLRPGQENDFSIETSEALVAFWKSLTQILFAVIPAVVAIGIVVGGIVIMNIMLMAVNERTREIGIRKAVGARARDIERQFLVETVMLSALGGVIGVLAGWAFAFLISVVSPLPARITWWSVAVALGLGAGIGVVFGVYPARRAARLDPVTAMRAE
ncbi:MAG: ABC transporter permease [Gemmatimonadaceae bacterium]|nr:ABC transporter permease [Gemmatimonadaceae bacterium]MCW5826279.1 ABC transporter permease [Gemmatimonadaceae bacterium]